MPKINTPAPQRNTLLGTMVDQAIKAHKSLIIDHEIDLQGQTINLKNVDLLFQKNGLLKNGILVGAGARHTSEKVKCYENIIIQGNWAVQKGYLEWFVGRSTSVPEHNFEALCNLVQMRCEIVLTNMYSIAPANPLVPADKQETIIISGEKNTTCGLILEKKSPNVFYPYFRSDKGNSLIFRNITLQTRDYLNGERTNAEADFVFTGSYYNAQFNPDARPDIEKIDISNCIINGAIALTAYGAHSENQSLTAFKKGNTVKKIQVHNNLFNYCNAPFGFSNIGYDSIIISDNKIYNFSASFISFAASGLDDKYYEDLYEKRKSVIISGNEFKNEKLIIVPKGRAMTPCVIKGGYGTMLFENNLLTNLLTASKDAEVYTFYYTCSGKGKAIIKNNTFYNVLARGSAELPGALVKERGCISLFLENNKFEITKTALVDIGVLKNKEQSLSSLNQADFYMDFIQIGTFPSLCKSYIIRNNQFKTPFINISTQVFDIANMLFENNVIEIGYIGPGLPNSTISKPGVLFLGRMRFDRDPSQAAGDFISQKNEITINSVYRPSLSYIMYSDGVQNSTATNIDTNYNYKNVVFNDNIQVSGLNISYSLLDAENQRIALTLNGKNNCFSIVDPTGSNHKRPNVKHLITELKIENDKFGELDAPFCLIPNARQKITVKKHQQSDIAVLSYNYINSLYNLEQDLPLQIEINLKWKDKSGKQKSNTYLLMLSKKYKSFYHAGKGNNIVGYDPTEQYGNKQTIIGSDENTEIELVVLNGNKHLKNAEIRLLNTQQMVSYELEIKCNNAKIEVDSDVEYKKVLTQQVQKIKTRAN